jgi:uncharacterized protein (TIGR02231 family)
MRIPIVLSLFLSVITPFTSRAADGEQNVPSTITAAKVFLSGAQVTRNAKSTISAGSATLVFTGLEQDMDPQSIQVTGKGGYSILSVAQRMNYLTESPNSKAITDLKAQIKLKEHDYNSEVGAKAVWDQEEQLLRKNTAIGGQQSGVSASQLQAVNDYVRDRMKAINTGKLAQAEKLAALNEDLSKLRLQLQQLQAQAPRPTSEVVLELSAPAEANATFILTYFVRSASWTPAYDLRATGTDKPIELAMKAQVVNSTGVDWNKVDLSLSSGDPTLGGIMPELYPWTLAQQYQLARAYHVQDKAAEMAPVMKSLGSASSDDLAEASSFVANTVSQRTTTLEFSIDAPFSVPADGLAHTVGVNSHTIPATYTWYCTPKLDKDAFLYARTTGWEDLSLLAGEANIFFEGTYVGKSFLQLDQPKDTLDISLGRDKGITVERVKRKTTNDKATIGGKRTVSVGWDITVRNTKAVPVTLELRDQYPLSPKSEVEVKLADSDGAEVDEQKGFLTWKLALEPKASRKVGFNYTVKYPKDMPMIVE